MLVAPDEWKVNKEDSVAPVMPDFIPTSPCAVAMLGIPFSPLNRNDLDQTQLRDIP